MGTFLMAGVLLPAISTTDGKFLSYKVLKNSIYIEICARIALHVQLFAYDTVKTFLTPKPGQSSLLPIPASSVAGASAGVCSTLCMYPLELLKTRLTIQVCI